MCWLASFMKNAAKVYWLSESGKKGRGKQSSFAFKAACKETPFVLYNHWEILTKPCYKLFGRKILQWVQVGRELTNRKLFDLKVTSVWVLLHTSLHYW